MVNLVCAAAGPAAESLEVGLTSHAPIDLRVPPLTSPLCSPAPNVHRGSRRPLRCYS
jgi:hypothetical protein